jgi:hypothetical protein
MGKSQRWDIVPRLYHPPGTYLVLVTIATSTRADVRKSKRAEKGNNQARNQSR